MDSAALAAFVTESLALWQVAGEASPSDDDAWVRVRGPDGATAAVERAPDGDPFRWYVRWEERVATRRRPCGSLVGVLAALRRAFGVERGAAIRIAPDAGADFEAPRQENAAAREGEAPASGERAPLSAAEPAIAGDARIPITVLTGFLGSGKTTLLARLLRDPALARTAVIVNELGKIGLDHELIETSDESFVQLSTGCLCCRVRSDLVATLDDLAVRRARGALPAFERVVIETSGLADPAPILHALMTDRGVAEAYALDAVVTTVDAVTGAQSLARHPESVRQVAVADTIVVTKVDLPQADAAAVETLAARTNAHARIVRAAHGDVTPDVLSRMSDRGDAPSFAAASCRARAIPAHEHTEGVGTCALVRESPVHAAALALFVSALADNCGDELLRVKGFVHVRERPEAPALVEGVQHVYFPPRWLSRWPSADRRTRLVFIGARLRPRWLEALLDLLDAEVAEAARTVHAGPTVPRPA